MATSCCRGRWRVRCRHTSARLRRGYASKDTHWYHATESAARGLLQPMAREDGHQRTSRLAEL